jgi:hypothetical protein
VHSLATLFKSSVLKVFVQTTGTMDQARAPQSTHSPNSVTSEGDDLVVWRNTTSTRLADDIEEDREASLFAFVRVFITVITMISFIIVTSPKNVIRDGFTLDATINMTIISSTTMNKSSPFMSFPVKENPTKTFTSVLGVPALFGREFEPGPYLAPIVVLEHIDACHPFHLNLPYVVSENIEKQIDIDAITEYARTRKGSQSVDEVDDDDTDDYKERTPTFPHMGVFLMAEPTSNDMDKPTTSPQASVPAPKTVMSASDASTARPISSGLTRKLLSDWYALVPRGHCPFDVKVFNAQMAGLAGIIIYNNGTTVTSMDLPVRMSPNTLGSEINSAQAMFVTNRDSKKLIDASKQEQQQQPKQNQLTQDKQTRSPQSSPWRPNSLTVDIIEEDLPVMLSVMAVDDWPSSGWGDPVLGGSPKYSLMRLLFDVFFLMTSAIIFGAVCTLLCMIVSMVRNYMIHGQWFVVITAPRYLFFSEESSEGIPINADSNNTSSNSEDEEGNMLEKVTLPLKIITAEDLEEVTETDEDKKDDAIPHEEKEVVRIKGGSRDCCAICIDEFVVGSRVRELPCNHRFHDSW